MYREENNRLLKSILGRTFFTKWRNMDNDALENFSKLEIILKYKCNLDCVYCYVKAHGEELYPDSIHLPEDALMQNVEMLLDWLYKNKMYPNLELFSGEPLFERVGIKALTIIVDKWIQYGVKNRVLVVPTNFTFLISDKLTELIEKQLNRAQESGNKIFLSASFDGKHMEQNRPFTHGVEVRDNDYYDKAFKFVEKWRLGYHPMIYSKGIELWQKNFLWFQEMFKKYEHPWWGMYLLEVRNPEWGTEQIKEFGRFIEWLIEWAWIQCEENTETFHDFLFKMKGFNILGSALSTVGRGMGCSLQSSVYVRMGDLSLVPCHRTSYDPFIIGKLVVKDNEIVDIEARNVEFYVSELSLQSKNMPYCERCMINCICPGGCLGAQFEETGDPFTPIPTVCALEHEKYSAMIRAYKKLGVFDYLMTKIGKCTRDAFYRLSDFMEVNRSDV